MCTSSKINKQANKQNFNKLSLGKKAEDLWEHKVWWDPEAEKDQS